MLELCNVWYRYPGGVIALKGASVKVGKGEIVAVIGPMDVGKPR